MNIKASTAQEIQDEIFRKMSADQKVLLGSQLWKLGRDLAKDKVLYDSKRSKAATGKYSSNS